MSIAILPSEGTYCVLIITNKFKIHSQLTPPDTLFVEILRLGLKLARELVQEINKGLLVFVSSGINKVINLSYNYL